MMDGREIRDSDHLATVLPHGSDCVLYISVGGSTPVAAAGAAKATGGPDSDKVGVLIRPDGIAAAAAASGGAGTRSSGVSGASLVLCYRTVDGRMDSVSVSPNSTWWDVHVQLMAKESGGSHPAAAVGQPASPASKLWPIVYSWSGRPLLHDSAQYLQTVGSWEVTSGEAFHVVMAPLCATDAAVCPVASSGVVPPAPPGAAAAAVGETVHVQCPVGVAITGKPPTGSTKKRETLKVCVPCGRLRSALVCAVWEARCVGMFHVHCAARRCRWGPQQWTT